MKPWRWSATRCAPRAWRTGQGAHQGAPASRRPRASCSRSSTGSICASIRHRGAAQQAEDAGLRARDRSSPTCSSAWRRRRSCSCAASICSSLERLASADHQAAHGDRCGVLRLLSAELFIEEPGREAPAGDQAAFPDALDMLLICVQSGMSVEAGVRQGVEGDRHPVARARRRIQPDDGRALLPAGSPPGVRESWQAHRDPGLKAVARR